MERSAGIAIVCENKILLCHSSRSRWFKSYMPPKGHVERGESNKEAACRETLEEVGIEVPMDLLGREFKINYIRAKKIFKEVFIYEYRVESLSELGLKSEIIPQTMLQLEEIDDAKFMDKDEASVRALPRYHDMINELLK